MSRTVRALLAAAALTFAAGAAQALECKGDPSNAKIVVNITGAKSAQGLMAVTIWREQGFMKKKGGSRSGLPPISRACAA